MMAGSGDLLTGCGRLDDRNRDSNREAARYSFTRGQLIDALTRLEAHVATSGPMAGKIIAESMADALIEALSGEAG